MEIIDVKKNVYIAYKNETSRYLAYILYHNLHRRKNLHVFYDKAEIEVSDAWKETLNRSLHKSNVCLIIGEKGAFDSLKNADYNADEFLNEVSYAIEKRIEKQSEIVYLAVEDYKPWEDNSLNSAQCIQHLQKYQWLSFHFKTKNERLIKEEIKEVVRKCETLCGNGFLKSFSDIKSSPEGEKGNVTKKRENFNYICYERY